MQPSQAVNAYLASFNTQQQARLQQLRQHIATLVPQAQECMSYGIPTFKTTKNIIHFAAYKTHIRLYPGAKAVTVFKDQLAPYKHAKGSIQFPLQQHLPLQLITEIVLYRLAEIESK